VPERDAVRCRYGLVEPLHSYNPIRIAFFQWLALARDLRGARRARDVAGYLFGPPGWAPDGRSSTTEAMRARVADAARAGAAAGPRGLAGGRPDRLASVE
jgi:hypothetical protein